ncbi:MAG: TIGR01777 family oxidoreductase [Balneolales bacterium]
MTGGTGFIGGRLGSHLKETGNSLIIATRYPHRYISQKDNIVRHPQTGFSSEGNGTGVQYVPLQDDMSEFIMGCRVIINLAGESLLGKRWTPRVRKRLYDSRIRTTQSVVNSIKHLERKPDLMISVSGVDYYGDTGKALVTEKNKAGKGFLADLCREWEFAAMEAESQGVRVVIPRFGIILGREGGALPVMIPVFKAFLGGSIGPGSQFFPWIHIRDLCRTVLFAMENDHITGPFNAVAPNPVTMDDFAVALGRVLSRPSLFKIPEFVLKIVLGEAAGMMTGSHRICPDKLQETGFSFEYPKIGDALSDLLL